MTVAFRPTLKASEHAGFEPRSAEPAQVRLSSAGVVTDIVQLKSRAQMDALDAEHVWLPPLIDMRFNYKPQNPLYLMAVRAHRLASPKTVANVPAYAGCKSWVPLGQNDAVKEFPCEASLGDQTFNQIVRRADELLR